MFQRLVFMLSAALSLVPMVLAQESVHQYARPGYATKTVYIWGAVGMPGVWKVEEDADLIELLSAAGLRGYGEDQRGGRTNLILRIYRKSAGSRSEIFREEVDRLLVGEQNYPSLQEEDVLAIEAKQRFGWQNVTAILGAAASVSLLVIRIVAFTS